jgi:putative ABC transport system permease protein
MPFRLSALNRKLLRDLWEMRSQALAIALVVGAGVAMYVAYLSNFDSLRRTVDQYYQRQRFADVFVALTRAPQRVADRLAAIPGVDVVETRVSVAVTLDVPGMSEPAAGLVVSIPGDGRPRINDVFLRQGRWPDPTRPDEVLASEAFCTAHGFSTGAQVTAIINGRRRALQIVGIALSPEHVYAIPPGEMIPDDRRFGIFWMERRALAAAYDMEGGFNQASFQLSRALTPAQREDVLTQADELLDAYGSRGAIPRERQFSAWMLENELAQLQTFGFIVPLIFLGVAAFILNIALTRALALQRPQIAALKALGYGNSALAWHYLKWALLIAGIGGVAGVAAGAWLGGAMIQLYNQYFRFPSLEYTLTGSVVVGAFLISAASAAVGAWTAVRRAVRVPPAEAMRPEVPARYTRSLLERLSFFPRLGPTMRMVMRGLERQPVRSLASIVGIALAGAVLFVGFVFINAITALMDTEFSVRMRQDVSVSFVLPRSANTVHALQRLPGVQRVEPYRSVPVRLRAGPRERTLSLTGADPGATLQRVVTQAGLPIPIPSSGLVLSQVLADALRVRPGDEVAVDVLEGRRPRLTMAVASVVDDSMGLQAYMPIDALHRALREDALLSGAYLMVDPHAMPTLHQTLKAIPAVAGVALTEVMRRRFRETMAENLALQIGINVVFSAIIAFGVVYNAARISLSERSRELASLRVLGFTRAEISSILLGELAVVTLVSLPIGSAIGYSLSRLIVSSFASEVFRIPLVVTTSTIAWAWIVVVIAAAVSALIVRRRLDTLDLVAVLKTRE